MQDAIDWLQTMTVPNTRLDDLAACFEEKLARCEVCVFTPTSTEGAEAYTVADNNDEWSGDMTMISENLIRWGDEDRPTTSNPHPYFWCRLVAVLVHEASHAANTSPYTGLMLGAKKYEKDAIDIQKAVLDVRDRAMGTSPARAKGTTYVGW